MSGGWKRTEAAWARGACRYFATTLAALGSLLTQPAAACAPAPPLDRFVSIDEESAVIVWDAARRVEHFVRRAAFRTDARDFGFLVPTPAQPELAEVDDGVFNRLEQVTRPELVTKPNYVLDPSMMCSLGLFLVGASKSAPDVSAAAGVAPVRVLDQQRVSGYDAVVLEADSPPALLDWLGRHGYASRPELGDWLAPYVAARWKLTAFKIAPAAQATAVATSAVRMSFASERPFFPYREPAYQREAHHDGASHGNQGRSLRVYFVGPERVSGSLGAARLAWPGKTLYAAELDRATMALPPPLDVAGKLWLTAFDDVSAPRPGVDDLFFERSVEPGPVRPPPLVWHVDQPLFLPLDLFALLGLGGWWLMRKLRRRAASGANATGI